MAYHNASGQVTIDESAANQDIQKMRNAIAKLEDSKRSITKLSHAASSMRGQTGSAIVEKCGQLDKQVEELTSQLNRSIRYIQQTVKKYKEEDHQLAQKIRSGGGF